jgi:methionine-gamma-lyase
MKKIFRIDSLCAKDNGKEFRHAPHNLPIYQTSAFTYDNHEESVEVFEGRKTGYVYSRYKNPTIDMAAQKLADLESYPQKNAAFCYLTNTGMSAITGIIQSLCQQGDCILTQRNLYGGTIELLEKPFKRNHIQTVYNAFKNENEIIQALETNPSIKIIYLESPTNPTLDVIDLEMVAGIAKKYKIKTIVDNTLNTPYLLQPLQWGIDYVVHSTTKFLSGHGNMIGGAIVGNKGDVNEQLIWENIKLLGLTPSPFDSWLLYNGIKTLALRMEKQSANASLLSHYLQQHDKIEWVNSLSLSQHPSHALIHKMYTQGHVALLSFALKGDAKNVGKFLNALEFCSIVPTLGDLDTLVLHPATSSHLKVDKKQKEQSGITDNLIRISVGIENSKDIVEDIDQALSKL